MQEVLFFFKIAERFFECLIIEQGNEVDDCLRDGKSTQKGIVFADGIQTFDLTRADNPDLFGEFRDDFFYFLSIPAPTPVDIQIDPFSYFCQFHERRDTKEVPRIFSSNFAVTDQAQNRYKLKSFLHRGVADMQQFTAFFPKNSLEKKAHDESAVSLLLNAFSKPEYPLVSACIRRYQN